jgi:hypothetical protein
MPEFAGAIPTRRTGTPDPPAVPAFEWLIAALRARP